MAPQTIPPKRVLPSKEATMFKELLSLYETHQLKKAQKTADQILKKFPEHGETLAMKGLVIFQTGRKQEGLELIRKGMRFDLTSHIVWHVFGLAKKSEKDYDEAVKSYTQALRYEKDNINILRDAANLHMQLRNYDSLEEIRMNILQLRPNLRQSWVALAMACHLNDNLADAKAYLEAYESLLKNIPDFDPLRSEPLLIEHSEVLLYHVYILELLGEYSSALDFLETNIAHRRIIDPTNALLYRARLLHKLGRTEESKQKWRDLIDRNPDCDDYYYGLLACQGIDIMNLTHETRISCLKLLEDLSKTYSSSGTATRLALEAAIGNEFRALASHFIRNGLLKGVPSLFVDIKALLSNPEKSMAIKAIITDFLDSPELTDDPTFLLWCNYFYAQYLSCCDEQVAALELVEKMLSHSPTLPEIHALKAKILKRGGDIESASIAMEEARSLDGQDRFLNWKAAKYLLRANKHEAAEKLLGLFTKKDAVSPAYDLEEMQSLDFLIEEAEAYYRIGDLGMSLKRFKTVEKIFADFEDDQFDFHTYAIRKFTINSYLRVVQWEDHVKKHLIYVRCALGASQIYLGLHHESQNAVNGKTLKKKAKRNTRDVQQPKRGEGNYYLALLFMFLFDSPKGSSINGVVNPQPTDEDPDGSLLLTVPNPLEQAIKMLRPLLYDEQTDQRIWISAFDIAFHQGRYAQALRFLKRGRALMPQDPEIHIRLFKFAHTNRRSPTLFPPLVQNELAKLIPDEISLQIFNQRYLQSNADQGYAIWGAAIVNAHLDYGDEQVEELILTVLDPHTRIDIKLLRKVFQFLKSKDETRLLEKFVECAQTRFPLWKELGFHYPNVSSSENSQTSRNQPSEVIF